MAGTRAGEPVVVCARAAIQLASCRLLSSERSVELGSVWLAANATTRAFAGPRGYPRQTRRTQPTSRESRLAGIPALARSRILLSPEFKPRDMRTRWLGRPAAQRRAPAGPRRRQARRQAR